eukprot:TRINITY_DN6273_c0_g1_i1.p1 TRINITY_DN6273_c0_g1~~TRINITY_DN6273_c0_g1_i1.p1  ORF type:complete len:150 (+),score=38.18 TRINITY_DN6273_c0_g1_i1:145-594(+)
MCIRDRYSRREGTMDHEPNQIQFALALTQATVQPLHGLFTFVIFSLNKTMLTEYRRLFGQRFLRQDVPPSRTEESKKDKVEVSAMQQQLRALQEQIALLSQARESALHLNPSVGAGGALGDLDRAMTALKEQSSRLAQQLTMAEMSGQF